MNLPNGILSSLTNATIEIWVTWNQSGTTGQSWQRIFDFGTTGTEDMQVTTGDSNMSYLFLCPRIGVSPYVLQAAYTVTGLAGETTVRGPAELGRGATHHLAVVVDDTNDELVLYQDGSRLAVTAFAGSLAAISDVNNWIGRSTHSGDYEFIGVFDEFRIYEVALSDAQISTSFEAGPNPDFL